MITIGTQLDTLVRGRHMRYRIAAIRHAPFSYVELEPVDGGPRRQLPMYVAERIPVVDDGTPTPADIAEQEAVRKAPEASRKWSRSAPP